MVTSVQRVEYSRLVFYISLGTIYSTVVNSQDLNPTCCQYGESCYKPDACKNGGICHSGECNCLPNFYGSNCQFVRHCAKRSCQNDGICSSDGVCVCSDDFYGETCQFMREDTTSRQCKRPCENGGTCSILLGICICLDDYIGEACETRVIPDMDFDPRKCRFTTDCYGNGVCLSGGHCVCNAGYHGDHCQFGNGMGGGIDESYSGSKSSNTSGEYLYYFIGCIIIVVILFVVIGVRASVRRRRMRCRRQTVATLGNSSGYFLTATVCSNSSNSTHINSSCIMSVPTITDLPPAYHTVQEVPLQELSHMGDLPPSYEEALKLREQPGTSIDAVTESNSEL